MSANFLEPLRDSFDSHVVAYIISCPPSMPSSASQNPKHLTLSVVQQEKKVVINNSKIILHEGMLDAMSAPCCSQYNIIESSRFRNDIVHNGRGSNIRFTNCGDGDTEGVHDVKATNSGRSMMCPSHYRSAQHFHLHLEISIKTKIPLKYVYPQEANP
jgi:hypothetical protein